MSDSENKIVNDATSTIKGILYQFYVALQYCFELLPGEVLYIEKYGDITISDSQQIEVKNYSNPLTDTQDNFWNTLHNWCSESFDPKPYKNLILLTTQQIGKKSSFIEWNEKKLDEKLEILKNISNKYCNDNKNSSSNNIKAKITQMKSVVSEQNEERLKLVLSKFVIIDSATNYSEICKELKSKYIKHIEEEKQEFYLNELLGYIINPNVVKNNWKITYEAFTRQVQTLTSLYCAKTVVFPEIKKPSKDEIDEKCASLFVDKIRAIEYEEVKNEAICDFLSTNTLLIEDFANYTVNPKMIENYANELLRSYNPKRRIYTRKVSNENDKKIIINESKNFYDEITAETAQPFLNYNDTPRSFRNGLYHIMADDEKNDKKIVWLLKDSENEND